MFMNPDLRGRTRGIFEKVHNEFETADDLRLQAVSEAEQDICVDLAKCGNRITKITRL
jgi:hypothetical protein